MKKAFLTIPLLMGLLFFSAGPALAQNKLGINIAARHDEFDQAARLVGAGGWVVIMASPGNADELKPILASHPEVNIILRGHCPSDPLGPNDEENRKFALSWAATLGGLETAGRKIFFMPWNEPNMTRECQGTGDDYNANNTDCAPHVVKYIGYLRDYLSQSGLLGNKVELLSPMINQHHANYRNFIAAMGGRGFFESNFYGVSMNLYDNETCGSSPLCHGDSLRNAGRFNEVLSSVGLAGLRAFSVETGIIDASGTCPSSVTDCPFFDDSRMASLLSAAYPIWNKAGNFVMFSPLSYNPETNDSSWIYGGTTESFYLNHQVSGQVFKGSSPASFAGWRDSRGLTTCPGSPNTYILPGGACGFCAGGSTALLSCKPVPADQFGEEYSKETLKLSETVRKTLTNACTTSEFTAKITATNISIPFAHELNEYFLGPYMDNLGARIGKQNLNSLTDYGIFEKMAPRGYQDELRLKFLDEVARRGANSKYAKFKINGLGPQQIADKFKNSPDIYFLKAVWPQVPLFANEESEGEIVFEGPGLTGTIRTSIPEVYRLNRVTQETAKMIGIFGSTQNEALSSSSRVLPANDSCPTENWPRRVSDKETLSGAGSAVCVKEEFQPVPEANNLAGVRTYDQSIFSFIDFGENCDNKAVGDCCGVGKKCQGTSPCLNGGCRCEGDYQECRIRADKQTFETEINIKNRVPFLSEIAKNTVGDQGIFRAFVSQLTKEGKIPADDQVVEQQFREVAGESKASLNINKDQIKITKGEISVEPQTESNLVTLLFHKMGTMINVKNLVSGVILWPWQNSGASAYSVNAGNLAELFEQIGNATGVPPKILEAVMQVESPDSFKLTAEEVKNYSQAGAKLPDCGPNECSATGPMQLTTGTDNYGSTSCSHCACYSEGRCKECPNQWANHHCSGDPCNLTDNLTCAAKKLKADSGAGSLNWTAEQANAAISAYGGCDIKYLRLGNRTYCEFVWDYYSGSL